MTEKTVRAQRAIAALFALDIDLEPGPGSNLALLSALSNRTADRRNQSERTEFED